MESDSLQDPQYRFRKGRSTVDADNELLEIAKDVRNAFNSASWELILEEMAEKGMPQYIYNIIKLPPGQIHHTDVRRGSCLREKGHRCYSAGLNTGPNFMEHIIL